jgi:post-segregation antitoxin (ccd killing protein)
MPMTSTADGPWVSLNEKARGPVSGSTSTATPSAEYSIRRYHAARGKKTGCPTPDRRILRRMPRVQVYLPDDLYDELKRRDLPASELLQVAVRAEVQRRQALDATQEYVAELAAEVGEPTARHEARAEAIVRRIRDRQLDRAV